MLALGAVIMMCAVAIIGAGYAAFSNTANARTYNEGNSATAGYMKLTPNGEGAARWTGISNAAEADFSSYFYNDGVNDSTAYYFDGTPTSATVDGTEGYTVLSLGSKVYTLENETGAAITTVSFAVTQDKLVGNGDFIYIVCVDGVYKSLKYTGELAAITFTVTVDGEPGTEGKQPLDNTSSCDISVALYIGYLADCKIPTTWHGNVLPTSAESGTPAKHGASPTGIPANDALSLSFAVTVAA